MAENPSAFSSHLLADAVRVHSDWSTAGFALAPMASETSVFPTRGFLESWWNHFGSGELRIIEGEAALAALWHRPDGVVALVGDPDLTDYHSPLGNRAATTLADYLAQLEGSSAYHFDSLPAEAAEPLGASLGNATVEEQEAAYRLVLPGAVDNFWQDLSKKERHEMRRKRRRFTESLGEPRIVQGTQDPMGVFVEIHRMAPGEKGQFMTRGREAFFRDLALLPGARVDLIAGDGDEIVAAAFGFEDASGYYLYNSAYIPDRSEASPGIVALSHLIEDAIERGRTMFDFLKGDETYKLRLGANARPLFSVRGTT